MNEDKGICRLSLVPMRTEPFDHAALASELLFGEHYSICENQGDWLKVELHFDQSSGWIRGDQHDAISPEYFEQINNSDYKVCTDVAADILFKKKRVNVLIGSILPISTNELFKIEEQVAFNGSSKSLNQKREFEFLKEILSKYMYSPYLPGGKSPFGIDEGGFVQQVFKICGYRLARTLDDQIKQGSSVNSLGDAQPGDVVFAGDSTPNGGFVKLSENEYIGVFDGVVQKIDSSYFSNNTSGIRRILQE